MQLDYYVYEYDLRTRVVPDGQKRAAAAGGATGRQAVFA
jgi:hypothetical protein